jgi:hypothetical protein
MRSAVSPELHVIPRARVVVVGNLPPLDRLAAGLGHLEHVDRIDADHDWNPRDIVVVRTEDQSAHEATLEVLARQPVGGVPRVVVTGEGATAALRPLIERHGVVHVVGTQGAAAERDLAVTIDKLLSDQVFGLDRYLGDSAAPARFVSTSSARRDHLLEWMRAYCDDHRIKRRVVDLMLVVADELFTNAFYNAPVDAAGRHVYADLPRTTKVSLEPTEVAIEVRCDGNRLGIAAVDPFGSLTREVVLASLRRCFRRAEPREDSTGGAGLGLFLLLSSLTSVVFNVAPGRRTEVIGLIDIAGTFRQSMSSGKSFNLFEEGSR